MVQVQYIQYQYILYKWEQYQVLLLYLFILVPIECHGTLLYNLHFVEILRVFTYLLYCNIPTYVPKIHKSFDQIEKVRIRNLLQ